MNIKLRNDNNVKNDGKFSDGTSFSYETKFVLGHYSDDPEEDRYDVKIHILDTDSEKLKEALDKSDCLTFKFGRNGEYSLRYVEIGDDKLCVENPTSF
ncbi:hypothetical protein FAM18132_00298 [Lacticaseibacillus paracasei]|uniref:hypothetical protein n=1 Tax=Lacticaseibacillus paracasei TaxID=1597 RepID=UPI000F0BAEBF|nr:hypothetical protein [Lacticaseibacillus paracasei]RND40896.1 hypothetical protein FAM18101_00663 [Lacticaseibacillus paracasei]RND47389.1 hypothetical protein FAM18105_00578 [Lacticaseibacillus paracasei]RND51620.1 hypothetical protein FAM18119_02920 [Lacticaseibacillus paracasei]RND74657.1 hypothetical protein FAM18132_00298 [Lacticaseibacillus paracasei]